VVENNIVVVTKARDAAMTDVLMLNFMICPILYCYFLRFEKKPIYFFKLNIDSF
jgi:hypothetical protein